MRPLPILVSVLFCVSLAASPIVKVIPSPVQPESTPCPSIGAGYTCVTTPYIDTASWDASNVVFNKTDSSSRVGAGIPYPIGNNLFYEAWNAWDNASVDKGGGGGGTWTLLDGTNGGQNDLTGTFTAFFGSNISQTDPPGPALGGVSLQVIIGGIKGLPQNQQVVWAQGLYTSYSASGFATETNAGRPGPALQNQTQTDPPSFHMDILTPCGASYNIVQPGGGTAAAAVSCGPAYPFQDVFNSEFIDKPQAGYPDFFAAEAFLGIIDYNAKTLTIYDGIDYGFNNTVIPEPSTVLLICTGLFGVAGAMRRRNSHFSR